MKILKKKQSGFTLLEMTLSKTIQKELNVPIND